MHGGQAAAAAADRRADGFDDHDVGHGAGAYGRPRAATYMVQAARLYRDRTVTDFVPLLQPPDSPAVSGGAVVPRARQQRLRRRRAAAEAGDADVPAPQFLGMLGTVACWAVDVGADPARRATTRRVPRPPPALGRPARGPVDDRRPGRPARRVGPHAPLLRPLRHGHRAGPRRAGHALPDLRPPQLPAAGPGGDRAHHQRRRGAAGPGPPVPRSDVLVPRRLRGAGRDARGGRAAARCARRSASRSTTLRYEASQPWPFPHSLMIGFTATLGRAATS